MARATGIRRGRPADLATIQRLNAALFQYEHEQGFYTDDSFNLNWPYEAAGTKYFTDCLSDSLTSVVYIAEADGQTIGYLAAGITTRTFRAVNLIGELENMFVEAAYRRQGVGTQLINAFKNWAREHGAARIRVGAFSANQRSIALYHRCGFIDQELTLEQPLS